MKKTLMKLAIDDVQYLTLEFIDNARVLRLFDYITIRYCKGTKKYILYTNDYVTAVLRPFEFLLKKAIANQLNLHESISADIGFLWNEYLQDKKGYDFVEKPIENSTCWVGQIHHLFESKKWNTWFYNRHGGIYLEIVPKYKWHFLEPEENEKFVPYDEFIKNYKPLVIIKIDKKIAQKWLKTVSKLLATAQKNHEKAMQEAKDRKKAAMENELTTKK